MAEMPRLTSRPRSPHHWRRTSIQSLGAGAAVVALMLGAPIAQAQSAPASTPEFCVSCTGPEAAYRCTFAQANGRAAAPGMQLLCISTLAREGGHASCSIARAVTSPCPGTLKVLPWSQADRAPAPASPAAAAAPDPAAPAGSPVPAPLVPPSDDVEAKVFTRPGPGAPSAPGSAPKPPQGTAAPSAAPPPAERVAVPTPIPSAQPAPAAPVAADQNPTGAKPTWSDRSGAPAGTASAPAPASPTTTVQPSPADDAPSPSAEPLQSAGKAVEDAAKSTGSAFKKAGDAVSSAAKKSWTCLSTLFSDCD